MDSKQGPSWIVSACLLIGAVAVAYLIYSLAAENRDLKARIAEMQQAPPVDGLQAGDSLADVPVISLDGTESALPQLVEGGGVLVFLTTTCPYCKQTLPIWADLADAYAAQGVPFAGVSFHDATATSSYVETEGLNWPLWVLTSAEDAPKVRVPNVPFTALVDAEGRVTHAWLGILSDEAQQTLRSALDERFADRSRLLSGSSDRDPGCCPIPTPDTGVGL